MNKWNFLRKGSRFEEEVKKFKTLAEVFWNFPELEAIFGKDWLKNQKKNGFFPFLAQRLGELENAVREMKNVSGFNDWKNNIKSNLREFDSYEFEILEISRLANLANSVVIYPLVDEEDPDQTPLSELKVVRASTEFYVEMTKLRSMANPRNKVKKLVRKGIRQIPQDSAGFIFADASDVILNENMHYERDELIYNVVSKLSVLDKEVDQFFRGENTRILGIVFIEHFLTCDEEYRVSVCKKYCMKRNRYNKLGLNLTAVGDLIFPKTERKT